MASKEYLELLRDPRWQRMRLEVMQRDKFSCVECLRVDRTLNVHHTFYATGRAPWEYPAESLLTLCEGCHAMVTEVSRRLKAQVSRLRLAELSAVLGYAAGVEAMRSLFKKLDEFPLPASIEPRELMPGGAIATGFLHALDLVEVPEGVCEPAPSFLMDFQRLCRATEKELSLRWDASFAAGMASGDEKDPP